MTNSANQGVPPKGSPWGAASRKQTHICNRSLLLPDGSRNLKFANNFAPQSQKPKKIWWDLNRNALPRPEKWRKQTAIYNRHSIRTVFLRHKLERKGVGWGTVWVQGCARPRTHTPVRTQVNYVSCVDTQSAECLWSCEGTHSASVICSRFTLFG